MVPGVQASHELTGEFVPLAIDFGPRTGMRWIPEGADLSINIIPFGDLFQPFHLLAGDVAATFHSVGFKST